MKKIIKKCIAAALCLALAVGVFTLVVNGFVVLGTRSRVISAQEAAKMQDVDCILVLGCLVRDNGVPSHMLEDRLRRGVELYELGASGKLLMSGDHGRTDYNEVEAMKAYAVDAGIEPENVFMDHAGFSTYESIYRAKEIFQAKKILIVTQEYHLYRALYIAQRFGLEAYGVNADYRSYGGQLMRDVREVLARVKDFGTCLIKPAPTYLGDAIPIWGDGNLTNDENADFAA